MGTVTVDTTTQRYESSVQPEPDILLLHTTEGMGWPGYNSGGTAPHDTVRPIRGKGIEVRRHYPYDHNAKALRNESGGVETNRRGVIQVELRGTCDPKYRTNPDWYFWPDADDAVLSALADYYRPIMAEHGIPARAMAEFVAYPASYGATPTRLTHAEWNNGAGICGHQHAPENTHGDPGNFPIARFVAFLTNTPGGFLMALTDQQQTDLYNRILGGIPAGSVSGDKNPDGTPAKVLTSSAGDYLRRQIQAVGAEVAALAATVSALAASQPGQTLTAEQITEAAKAGAASALDEKITGADVVLEVQS